MPAETPLPISVTNGFFSSASSSEPNAEPAPVAEYKPKKRIPNEFQIGKFPVPVGIDVRIMRNVLDATYHYWVINSKVPSIDDVRSLAEETYGVKHAKATIAKIFDTPEFQGLIRARGVRWGSTAGLSSKQLLAVSIISDPTNRKSLGDKLRSAGATYAEYRAWMRDPVFSKSLDAVTGTIISENAGAIKTKMVEGALNGDLNKAKFVLELSGEFDPNNKELIQLRTMVNILLEILTRNVTDPDALARIGKELQSRIPGGTIKGELL